MRISILKDASGELVNDIADILNFELSERKNANRSYSLRAFANFLNVSPATISQVISDKRSISKKLESELLEKLGYGHERLKRRPSKKKKKFIIEKEIFELISHWHYYAILSLSQVKGAISKPGYIAKKLGLTPKIANEALVKLKRMGLVELSSNGTFKQITSELVTQSEVPSSAIRNYHKGSLDLAKLKIDEVPIDKREYRSVMIAGNSKKIKKAKKLISELKEMITEELESGQADEVYQLNIQLFPITNGEKNE